MPTTSLIGLFFITLALVFLGLAWLDYLKQGGKNNPLSQIRARVGKIFAVVGLLLFVLGRYIK
jgi:hypothetical protein